LESKLTGHSQPAFDLEECATKAPHSLGHLSETYVHGDTGVKRSIISSIYPEKLYYENTGHRTERVNKAAELVYGINNELGSKKNRTNLVLSKLSDSVVLTGQRSNFFSDLQAIEKANFFIAPILDESVEHLSNYPNLRAKANGKRRAKRKM
jgi:hypothetical protein